MDTRSYFITTLICGLMLSLACATGPGGTADPASPVLQPAIQVENSSGAAGHYLWGYWQVYIDPATLEGEIVSVRQAGGHLNVLQFLEQSPCANCFKLKGVTPNPDGTLNVNVSIKHPYSNKNLTGFDVRGIAMFNGTHVFPASGLVVSDRTKGEGEVVNADGYTTLYNPTTVGHGLEGYMKGKLATTTAPSSTLNGFKRFVTDNPANTRNAFYAGDEIIVTFQVDMPNAPNPWVFGYAVDASWTPATVKPVTDPMTQFPISANCPEPWEVVVTSVSCNLSDVPGDGSYVDLSIDVYDRTGKDSHHVPAIECPELFTGTVIWDPHWWEQDIPGGSTWRIIAYNSNNAPVGSYKLLVKVEDNANATAPDWLNLTSYQIITVPVVHFVDKPPVAKATADPNPQQVNEPVKLDGGASYDGDGYQIVKWEWDFENDGTWDDTQSLWWTYHTWTSPGTYDVQLRVTDDDGSTDTLDTPLEVVILPESGSLNWAKRAGGTDYDAGLGITTLSDNSTVVTGYFTGSTTFGPGETNETLLVSAGGVDIFIACYNPDGTLAWAKRAGGTDGDDEGLAITALSDDNIVVTGYFTGSATFGPGEPNETVLVSGVVSDIFIARYNPDLTLAWAKRAGGTSADYGNGITALSDDSTVVTGFFFGSATFGPGEPNETVLVSGVVSDIFIARYNPDGTLVWAKRAGGTDWDYGYAISALSDDSTVVTGYFQGSATFGKDEPNETDLVSAGGYDIFMARYNPDGTLSLAKGTGGTGEDFGRAITALSDDSTVMTGVFQGSVTFGQGEPNETVLNSAGSGDILIAGYNPDGTLAWAKSAGGTSDDEGWAITALSDDSTVVTGNFQSSATFGPGEPTETVLDSAGSYDILVARFYE